MDFDAVLAGADRLGPIAYLATVTPTGGPHVVPVHIDWHEGAAWVAVGPNDVKVRNISANPEVCIHYEVGEATDWDHLMVWGEAEVVADVATKKAMWNIFSYDLDEFDSAGPASPDTVLLQIQPRRALFLARYGMDGSDEWRRGPAT